MRLVTVGRFFQPAQAQLLRARLDAAGFHPYVMHETAALALEGYSMAAGGILVQVPESEADEVRSFLEGSEPAGGNESVG